LKICSPKKSKTKDITTTDKVTLIANFLFSISVASFVIVKKTVSTKNGVIIKNILIKVEINKSIIFPK
jgi:hypothetical protein